MPEDIRSRPNIPARGATLGRRAVARVIDAVLLGAAGGVLGLALEFSVVWLIVQAALAYGYFVVGDIVAGTTVGKRLLHLGVRGAGPRRPSATEAVRREAFVLLGAVPYAGPILALLAWATIALTIRASPTGQGVHDRIAGGTTVVTACGR